MGGHRRKRNVHGSLLLLGGFIAIVTWSWMHRRTTAAGQLAVTNEVVPSPGQKTRAPAASITMNLALKNVKRTPALDTITSPNIPLDCGIHATTRHFIYIKVDKTGSTTLASIFSRFILSNNLTVMVARGAHLNWKFDTVDQGWTAGPNRLREDKVDALVTHHVFNDTAYEKHFPADTKIIISLRHPVSWFQSATVYYPAVTPRAQRLKDKPVAEILRNESLFKLSRAGPTSIKTWLHLVQLQYLGYDYNQPSRDDPDTIQRYIQLILPRITNIILMEYYDASLVILGGRFCWKYPDLFYVKHTVHAKPLPVLSEKLADKLLSSERNLGDLLLYRAANTTWWNQPELKKTDFWLEVENFTKLNNQVNDYCSGACQRHLVIPQSRWHPRTVLDSQFCKRLRSTTSETSHQQLLSYARGNHPWKSQL